ncbi:hypothetical protein CSKR_102603 [Clonorchis sinensis]|uniref:Uncharacterized protein n=1 Tax=Clonorchis sinensis TaxID=79923 RepID=A0A3R7C3E0_CLOSI|nr:hypothetical protein CSKR_102603 [Clonorchis sinensis]
MAQNAFHHPARHASEAYRPVAARLACQSFPSKQREDNLGQATDEAADGNELPVCTTFPSGSLGGLRRAPTRSMGLSCVRVDGSPPPTPSPVYHGLREPAGASGMVGEAVSVR